VALVVGTYHICPPGGLHTMLWRDVVMLWREIKRVRQWQLVNQAHSTAYGAALALNGKDGGALRDLQRIEHEVLHG
jgi:RIO-like serine/threonine protein kinase